MKQNLPLRHTLPCKAAGLSPLSRLLALPLFFALLLGATFANAQATINVPGDQPTIQAAVNAAAPGDIVVVAPGTYTENVTIDKSLTLRSSGGRGSTNVTGISPGGSSTVTVAQGVNDVTIGGTNQGFTITGTDNLNPGSEVAAVYLRGPNNNITIRGNDIKAAGDLGLLTRTGQSIDNLTISGNIFSGKTFVGAEPAGCGSSQQFSLFNVPRHLVYVANSNGLLFSDNTITGTSGGASSCGPNGQGNNLVTLFGADGTNATICGNAFSGTTASFRPNLEVKRGTGASVTNNTFNAAGLIGAQTTHFIAGSTSLTGGNPSTIAGVASMNTFLPEGYYVTGVNVIYKNSTEASNAGTPIAANSAPITSASCATCLGTEAPNLFTSFAPNQPVPGGQTSASVCQNVGNVTFQFDNCIGGTVNWTGTNGTSGTGNIIAPTTNVGTVTYSATCTQGECVSTASMVSVTTTAPPTVSVSGGNSVVFTPTAGSNCTTLTANPSGTAPFTYSWKMGSTEIGTGPTQQVCPETTTTYTVTVTDANGCSSQPTAVTVTVKDVRCGNRNQNVTICYYGVTQCVSEKIAARYVKLGATIGGCGTGNARIGVEETGLEAPFALSVKGYPNPTQGGLTVEVMSRISGPAQMQVLDLTGRAVQQRVEQLLEGRNEVKFDLTAQPTGTYLIRAVDGQNRQGVVRVSKQ